jgi:hypothetical protein
MKTDTSLAKFIAISHQVSHAPLLNVSASSFHRALADKSGIIGTQMGTHNGADSCLSAKGRILRYHPITVTLSVARTEAMRNSRNILVGKPEGKG